MISSELFNLIVPLIDRGRRESRALTAPVDPVHRSTRASHVRSTWANTTGTAETSRLSPRNGFTTYFVLSPVSGVFCHRCQTRTGGPDRRHGRGARTTRFRRTLRRFRLASKARLTPQASIATRATLRDDRETSLRAARAGYFLPQIRITVKQNIFHFGT